MSATASGSTPAKGSSSSMYRGWLARQRAISTRRRSPPESAMAGAAARCEIENSPISSSSISWRFSASATLTSRIARMLSRTLRPRKTEASCGR
jgi:hypothetical protein